MEKVGIPAVVRRVGWGGGRSTEATNHARWPPRLPPWGGPSTWQSTTAALEHHLGLAHLRNRRSIQRKAHAIVRLLVRMEPFMADLARRTCPDCVDPCCRRATVWYDEIDLLVLGYTGSFWPPGQPMASVGDHCRYLGPTGCRLPRTRRPWICTWYLCAAQKSCLKSLDQTHQERLGRWLRGMKRLREGLLNEFIRASLMASYKGHPLRYPPP